MAVHGQREPLVGKHYDLSHKRINVEEWSVLLLIVESILPDIL